MRRLLYNKTFYLSYQWQQYIGTGYDTKALEKPIYNVKFIKS